MKIVYSIADLQPESGGPSRSVSALSAAVAESGAAVELVALEYGDGRAAPIVPPKPAQTTLVPCRGASTKGFRPPSEFEAALRKACAHGADVGGRRQVILHDNGLWLPTNHAAARVARRNQIPFIISPRGMLTPWAMRFHGFQKRLAWLLYQRRDLQSAKVLHATSRQEAEEFRALGLTQPVAVVANGVDLPDKSRGQRSEDGSQKSEVRNQTSDLRPPISGLRTLLFLSRIHPKKGLLDLVEAWALVQSTGPQEHCTAGQQVSGRPKWRVVVAGGDEEGHLAEVKAEIRKQKVENDFEFVGEVADEKKWDWYRSADLFVLPSKSENFGIVIAEALACGVPVITTRGTPWEDLTAHRCGWWTAMGVGPLADALNEAVRLTDEERHTMGLRGRKLVEDHYTWSAAAKKMVDVYLWMLGTRERPECLVAKYG